MSTLCAVSPFCSHVDLTLILSDPNTDEDVESPPARFYFESDRHGASTQ